MCGPILARTATEARSVCRARRSSASAAGGGRRGVRAGMATTRSGAPNAGASATPGATCIRCSSSVAAERPMSPNERPPDATLQPRPLHRQPPHDPIDPGSRGKGNRQPRRARYEDHALHRSRRDRLLRIERPARAAGAVARDGAEGVGAEGETEGAAAMIVKVQLSTYTELPVRQVLIYNKDRSVEWQGDITPEIE